MNDNLINLVPEEELKARKIKLYSRYANIILAVITLMLVGAGFFFIILNRQVKAEMNDQQDRIKLKEGTIKGLDKKESDIFVTSKKLDFINKVLLTRVDYEVLLKQVKKDTKNLSITNILVSSPEIKITGLSKDTLNLKEYNKKLIIQDDSVLKNCEIVNVALDKKTELLGFNINCFLK